MGFTRLLRNNSIHIKFTKSKNIVYEAVTFAGYVGLPTGYLPGKFTVAVNARFYPGTYFEYIETVLEEIINGEANIATQVVRNSLEMNLSFSDAKHYFTAQPLITNIYFIVGGTQSGEGVILARNQSSLKYMEEISQKNGKWYVLQTNYDRDAQPPIYDDRNYYANKAMDVYCLSGSNVTLSNLWDVLSVHPVLNLQTLYTAQTDAIKGNAMITHQRVCHTDNGTPCVL